MKKFLHVILFIVSLVFLLFSTEVNAQEKTFIANEDVSFTIALQNMKLAGKMSIEGGHFSLENDFITGGIIEFDFRSLSIVNARSAYQKYWIERTVKSTPFLDTRAYSTATLTFKEIKPTFSISGNAYIVADFTMKGITKEIEFEANFLYVDGHALGAGRLNINLADYNIHSPNLNESDNIVSFVFRISSEVNTDADLFNQDEDIDLDTALDNGG
ncbi:MAG: YceI family protein [Chitinophagales bacterium]|nr:YceI family protein [Chitinophagales bacterium]